MRSLDGMDDELDATELEEAEAARVSALRGRVSIAVAQPQGQGQRQDDQHGEGGNAQAGDPQAGTWPIAAPSQVDDSARASVRKCSTATRRPLPPTRRSGDARLPLRWLSCVRSVSPILPQHS